jgi:hypothetical protein
VTHGTYEMYIAGECDCPGCRDAYLRRRQMRFGGTSNVGHNRQRSLNDRDRKRLSRARRRAA